MAKKPPAPAAPQIELVPLDLLIPYARNSRTHSDEQTAQIAASIREFGFTNPVLVGAENDIIAGHGRVMAARKLGLAEVPCLRLGYLSDAQKRAYVIADNKLALNAGWDEELLKIELTSLRDDDGFDLDLLGFTGQELGSILADVGDHEPVDTDEGESTGGGGCEYLVVGKFRIPLETDEANQLVRVVEAYAEERGTTMGFGTYLIHQIDK